jgi:Apea-like HEPN
MNDARSLEKAVSDYLSESLKRLAGMHVWPRPPWSPVIHLGSDYFGDDLASDEGRLLAQAIELEFAERFAPEALDREFADLYTYRVLEAFVLLRTITSERRTDEDVMTMVVSELRALLAKPRNLLMTAVLLLDVGITDSTGPFNVGAARLLPLHFSDGLERVMYGLFPTLRGTDLRGSFRMWMGDDAVLVVVENHGRTYEEARDVNATAVQRMVDAGRLATGGSFESAFVVSGQPGHLTSWPTVFDVLPGRAFRWTRRAVQISRAMFDGIEATAQVFDQLRAGGDVVTPFDVAMYRYARTFQAAQWQEQVVDLAIALESMLGGGDEREEIGLRLRTRACWLLSSAGDPPSDLYNDIRVFYDLRSKIVHGVPAGEKYLRKTFARLRVHKKERGSGISAQVAVDRLREIVRRAILARASLALQNDASSVALWPVGSAADPSSILIEDAERMRWRDSWRGRFRALGFEADNPIAKLEVFAESPSDTASHLEDVDSSPIDPSS